MNRDPVRDAAALARVDGAVSAGNIALAEEFARAALASGLVSPKLLHLRSSWWARQNRNDNALADLRSAVDMAPDDVLVRNAYGVLLARLERWQDAVAQLDAAVKLKPDFAPAQAAFAWALEGAGDLDGARRACEAAIALKPDFVEPLVRLARLSIRRADWEAARAASERALAIDPRNYAALVTRAELAVADGELERGETLIGQLLRMNPGATLNGATANQVLGDLRDAQGRYAEAFAAYSTSNRVKHSHYAPRYERNTPQFAYCEWLADRFENVRPSQSAKIPDDSGAAGHVFLMGFPRSGTTLLENVLSSHPEVRTLSERDAFGDLRAAFLADEDGLARLAALTPDEIAKHRGSYWAAVRGFGLEPAGKIFIDKMPLATVKLPLIAKLFPRAKILFALRDPRDVVLSCFRRNFGINHTLFEFLDLQRTARFYASAMRFAGAARTAFDLDWHEVRNERLIADFGSEARSACAFIGVEWDAQLADFAARARERTIRTPSSAQIARGLNAEGVGQWRHYREQLAPVLPILQPWAERLGYEPD